MLSSASHMRYASNIENSMNARNVFCNHQTPISSHLPHHHQQHSHFGGSVGAFAPHIYNNHHHHLFNNLINNSAASNASSSESGHCSVSPSGYGTNHVEANLSGDNAGSTGGGQQQRLDAMAEKPGNGELEEVTGQALYAASNCSSGSFDNKIVGSPALQNRSAPKTSMEQYDGIDISPSSTPDHMLGSVENGGALGALPSALSAAAMASLSSSSSSASGKAFFPWMKSYTGECSLSFSLITRSLRFDQSNRSDCNIQLSPHGQSCSLPETLPIICLSILIAKHFLAF